MKVTELGSLVDDYQNFIAISRYARWMPEKNRRETWRETVDRYIGYLRTRTPLERNDPIFDELHDAILNHKVMPSMRGLMTAGTALDRENVALYNCAFLSVDSLRSFDEALYILMNGTGVGFSVEHKYVDQLPVLPDDFFHTSTTIVVEDSKLGWAKAFKELLALLAQGMIPRIDVSKVRPAGARLKTFGGRASGPQPLVDLFSFTIETFKTAAGRKLKPIECHDIMCKVGEVVVVGGVRRSALISLSDLSDYSMSQAKSGNWWEDSQHRALANNSAIYQGKPEVGQFLREWTNLYESKSGERGIVNMDSIKKHIDSFGRRDSSKIAGLNPCAEINLRDKGFCNLTEVIVEADDTIEDIQEKIRLATILGTLQSTFTNFKYLRKIWKQNAEEERLLGVSLTGIFGNRLLNGSEKNLDKILDHLREESVKVNAAWADRIGINRSAAVTTVKPSGTVSQLTGVSSGIHPWYAPYYIRSVRGDNKDPLTQLLKDEGIPSEPDVTKPDSTTVFFFPIKSPEGAVHTKDLTAIQHLEIWKVYREHWTEHNPSVTISVREHEWLEVGTWVYENFDSIGGISFLPMSEHTYKQAPYQEITKEEYDNLKARMPGAVNWSMLTLYELEDSTVSSGTLACTSSSCEVVDIGSVM